MGRFWAGLLKVWFCLSKHCFEGLLKLIPSVICWVEMGNKVGCELGCSGDPPRQCQGQPLCPGAALDACRCPQEQCLPACSA